MFPSINMYKQHTQYFYFIQHYCVWKLKIKCEAACKQTPPHFSHIENLAHLLLYIQNLKNVKKKKKAKKTTLNPKFQFKTCAERHIEKSLLIFI